MQDSTLQILRTMVSYGENRFCFDCHQRGPTYVNMTIGSFVCTACGGALRKYNHRVKSISMSNFSQADIDFLCTRGNKMCRNIYLALSDDQSLTEKELKDAALDNFLRQKYQVQQWYREPTPQLEAETLRENKQLLESAEKNANQKTHHHIGANAAAGLIVLPTRSNVVRVSSRPSCNIEQLGSSTHQSTGNLNGQSSVSHSTPNLFDSHQKDTFITLPKMFESPKQSTLSIDPFSPFPSQPSTANTDLSNQKIVQDLFTQVSKEINYTEVPSCTNNTASVCWSDLFTSQPPKSTSSGISITSSGDKYAALAELDGLFKNVSLTSPSSSNAFNNFPFDSSKFVNSNTVVSSNQWPISHSAVSPQFITPFTPSYTVDHQWPASSSNLSDTVNPRNPFTATTLPTEGFARYPNPLTNYAMNLPTSNCIVPPPFTDINKTAIFENKNPFLTGQPRSVNPFSSVLSTGQFIPHNPLNFNPYVTQTAGVASNSVSQNKLDNHTNGITELFESVKYPVTSNKFTGSTIPNFNPF